MLQGWDLGTRGGDLGVAGTRRGSSKRGRWGWRQLIPDEINDDGS